MGSTLHLPAALGCGGYGGRYCLEAVLAYGVLGFKTDKNDYCCTETPLVPPAKVAKQAVGGTTQCLCPRGST